MTQRNSSKAAPEVGKLLFNRKEVAKALGVSEPTVTALTRQGMPCVYIGRVRTSRRGARPRYDLDKVRAWLETR